MPLLEIVILISQFWNVLFWNDSEMIDTHKVDRCRVDQMLSPQCSSNRYWGLKLDHPQDLVGGIQSGGSLKGLLANVADTDDSFVLLDYYPFLISFVFTCFLSTGCGHGICKYIFLAM